MQHISASRVETWHSSNQRTRLDAERIESRFFSGISGVSPVRLSLVIGYSDFDKGIVTRIRITPIPSFFP